MTTLVLDASVIVKWVLPSDDEPDTERALALAQRVKDGTVSILQPPHWLAEVAAVLARLEPALAPEAVGLLYAMEFPVLDDPAVYVDACRLAARFGHHVFDTLYHAVSLQQHGATFVTADDRYYRKARRVGAIARLRDLDPAPV